MVLNSWIKCLDMLRISNEINSFLEDSMRSWNAKVLFGDESLRKGDMERGIFQAAPLSTLIFVICLTHQLRSAESGYECASNEQKVNHFSWMTSNGMPGVKTDSLIQTVRVFSENIGMEFGNEKCVTLNIRGNIVKFK